MNLPLTVLAALAAVNPFRVGAVLAGRDRMVAAIGGVIALAALLVVAALSGPVLDWLEITTPTARIGAGMAVILVGARALVLRPPEPDPALPGRRAALVPVAFPVLVDPGLVLLTLAVANERGVAPGLGVAAVAIVVGVTIGLASAGRPVVLRIANALVGGIAVAAGVAVTISGVFDL